MPISKYQKKRIDLLKRRAFKLYKQGLTTREVGAIVKRSHEWVAQAVRQLEGVDKSS